MPDPLMFQAQFAMAEQALRLAYQAKPSELLAHLDHAETVAAITDPTLLREAMDGAEQMRLLLRSLLPAEELAKRAMAEEATDA